MLDKYLPKSVFTVLDLELNQPSNKIIQIGAIVGDVYTGQVLEQFCADINPEETLNPVIIQLTGITQEQVDQGCTLLAGYQALVGLHRAHNSFMNPIVWGGGDTVLLGQQLAALGKPYEWVFGRRWIDAKTLYIAKRIQDRDPLQGGLKKACHRLGLKFEGPAHNALQDSVNTFKIFRKLLEIA